MEKYIFNPLNNKFPKGTCEVNTEVKYTLKISKFEQPNNAYFVMHKDGEEPKFYLMEKEFTDDKYINYSYNFQYLEAGHYWYHFEVAYNDYQTKLIRGDNLDIYESNADSDYLQLVINCDSNTSNDFHNGIIYHIFVDRFCKVGTVKARKGLNLITDWSEPVDKEYDEIGNRINANCYGGNLQGIISKLPYLKSLNVKTIYLSPIFEANSSHKYDTADYSKIDSMFGDEEIFNELITKADKNGIKVIIDGVFNHTGSDSIYFNKNNRYKSVGAYQSQKSKYFDWYQFDNYPNDYSCWWGIKTLPQTREESGFAEYITGKNGIINKYMNLGLFGFRLDVVDELSNKFLSSICKSIKGVNPNALIVGEVWEDASSKIAYDERKEYFLGNALDSVTNYPMKNAILNFIKYGDITNFVNVTNLILDQYPANIRNNLMNILDTHDTIRAITYLGADFNNIDYSENEKYILLPEEYEYGKKLLKLATIMQYTVIGVPTVYYGDEAGVQGNKDPYSRETYPWNNEDTELVEWYQKLGKLRDNSVLSNGDMNIIYAENSVIIYERVKEDKKIIVAINKSNEIYEFTVEKNMIDFFTGNHITGNICLEPNSAIVLY